MIPRNKSLGRLLFCIENDLYRDYLKATFRSEDEIFIDYRQFVFQVAEDPQGILVLQSESHEYDIIEMCKRLKRLFPDTIKIVLLSADYRVQEIAHTVIDRFLQFPVSRDDLIFALNELAHKKRKILLIDDSKLVHKHICPPLAEEGYETFSAMDGQEGLEMAQAIVPDLIISDIEMPRLNGFETCSAIRKVPSLADVPIIMSSTLGSISDQRKGFAAGVDEYITKPVNIPDLLARLDRIFHRNLAGRENVLIIEPDQNIARNLTKTLAKQGFSPRLCPGIKDAVRMLQKYIFEVVITETELADGTAIDLLRAIQDLPRAHRSSLAVLTDHDNQAEVKMVMQAGAKGVIQKPFNQDNLLANVERMVANQRAENEKAHIEKYVSKASRKMALEKSILSGAEDSSRAYSKNATIFFSDIQNFTARCERYSPRDVVDQINTLFSVMTRVITESGGDIDKFIGDACMAFWIDDDPVQSSASALGFMARIRDEIRTMSRSHPLLKDDPIAIRMGLNTGNVILCDIGAAEARIDLTMIGDPVNLAARLESGAKQYGLDNLVSEFAYQGLSQQFSVRPVDWIRVKGKDKAVEVFELLGRAGELESRQTDLVGAYTRALGEYRAGNFPVARKLFALAAPLEDRPQDLNPSTLMNRRCQALLAKPPSEWTGVWTLSSK
jgi:DNA-binding response OmpR family regulator